MDITQRRKKLIAILIGIIIIISIIGIVLTSPILNEEDELLAVAQADKYIVYINDVISFTSEESKGIIKNTSWSFGEGNVSDEPNPTYSYEYSGWYEVHLIITGSSGRTDNTSIIIGVQNLNRTAVRDVGRWVVLNPSRRSGPANSVVVGPNIAHPTVTISIELDRPLGTFIFTIEVTIGQTADVRQQIELYTETITLTGGSYLFEYTVEPTDLPDEVSNMYSMVDAVVQIDEGKCQGAIFTLTSEFPIDNLDEPIN